MPPAPVAEFTVTAPASSAFFQALLGQDATVTVGTLTIVTDSTTGWSISGANGTANSRLVFQGATGSPAFLNVDTNGSVRSERLQPVRLPHDLRERRDRDHAGQRHDRADVRGRRRDRRPVQIRGGDAEIRGQQRQLAGRRQPFRRTHRGLSGEQSQPGLYPVGQSCGAGRNLELHPCQ